MTNKKFTPKGRKKEEDKSFITSLIRNDPDVRKVFEEEAHRIEIAEQNKVARDSDILLLMALHEIYGFGEVRLKRFVKGLVELREYFKDFYEDDYIYAMEMRLKKETGIDIDEIEKEIENYVKSANQG